MWRCPSAGGAGDRTADLVISGQHALPPDVSVLCLQLLLLPLKNPRGSWLQALSVN